tara:strand:- start:5428 stop:5835 length:408 start_codon:yes stop_codon:yes gene_type:complete
MEASAGLKILRELTPQLPALVRSGTTTIEYNIENGECFGFGLYNNGKVAVQRNFISKGSLFPEHTHGETEHIVIYSGSLTFVVDGESKKLSADIPEENHILIPPNTQHSVIEVEEDCWIIGITIPAGEGYPDAAK